VSILLLEGIEKMEKREEKCKVEITKSMVNIVRLILKWRVQKEDTKPREDKLVLRFAEKEVAEKAIEVVNLVFLTLSSNLRVEAEDSEVTTILPTYYR
jgi:hypothetical protein